ncbi:MAG: hypothetical protein KR126chlam2_01397, partial [Chlamydiae bacterium]|nr:hypothetical protein [Chlamydiota bacterium]
LHVAFVPHFESLRKESPQKAARFFHDLSAGLTLILLLLTFIGEGILGSFLLFGDLEPGNVEIIRLTMVLMPALLFISLYALNTSLLNCERSYFLPSVAPVALNLIWIGAVLFLYRRTTPEAMLYLSMVLVFAFAAQWLVTVPRVYRFLATTLGPKWWLQKEKMGREILRIFRPFLLALIGVTATQINSALDAIFARSADPEGPALLWYALRLQQLPLALFGVGLTGALLPPISRALEAGDRPRYLQFLALAFRRVVTYMIPITAACFALGLVSVNLVYGRGEFSQAATYTTSRCLWAYGAGLVPMTLVLILAAAFYAHKEYRIPSLISVATVLLNIGLNSLFVYGFHLGAISVALATTLTSCVNVAALFYFLMKKEGGLEKIPFLKVAGCSLFAIAITITLSSWLFHDNTLSSLLGRPLYPFPRHFLTQLGTFGAETLLFATTFLLSARLLKIEEFRFNVRSVFNFKRVS